jgi:hypothetical protein
MYEWIIFYVFVLTIAIYIYISCSNHSKNKQFNTIEFLSKLGYVICIASSMALGCICSLVMLNNSQKDIEQYDHSTGHFDRACDNIKNATILHSFSKLIGHLN